MKINEERGGSPIPFSQRTIGDVYRDDDGDLVIMDDQEGAVRLLDGFRWSPGPNSEFVPVPAKVVIES